MSESLCCYPTSVVEIFSHTLIENMMIEVSRDLVIIIFNFFTVG